jgi:hypothetical protein
LVQHLESLDTLLDAVKRLNADFNLGLDIDNAGAVINLEERARAEHDKRVRGSLNVWVETKINVLKAYRWKLVSYLELFKPITPAMELHPLFVEALHWREYIEATLDFLITATPKAKARFYNNENNRKGIEEIERRFR